jgi:hypothetical protein
MVKLTFPQVFQEGWEVVCKRDKHNAAVGWELLVLLEIHGQQE